MAITQLGPRHIDTGIGQALGTGLQNLANLKAQQLMQRNQQSQLVQGLGALGIPQTEAQQLALLPPELQQTIVKNYLAGAENMGLNQALGQLSGENQPQNVENARLTTEQAPAGQMQAGQANQPKTFAEVLRNPRLKPEHRLKVEALKQQKELAQQKIKSSEQREIDKETLPAYKEILTNAKDAKENDRRLSRMEELLQKGNLSDPRFHSLLDTLSHGIFGFGIDLHSLETADSQEFNKLSNEFVKNAKSIFGARITDQDLKTFLKMVPTLSQTDQGKERIINNMRAGSKSAEIRKNAMDQIIKENGGRRPRNLESLIEDRAGKELDLLADEFKRGYGKQSAPEDIGLGRSLARGAKNVLGGLAGVGEELFGGI